jgi:uncharacterized RDD family membrane protein YckC
MFCTFCGVENPDYATFCRKCGSAIGALESDKLSERPVASHTDDRVATEVKLVGNSAQAGSHDEPPTSGDYHAYETHYKSLTTDELVRLSAEKESLHADAQKALHNELLRRHVSDEQVGEQFEPASRPLVLYASLGQRFQAYFADVVVVYLVVFLAYFTSGVLRVFGKNPFLSEDASEVYVVYFIVLCSYMTLALTLYHTTIGKYALGLEVASAKTVGAYPSFWRVLLRETVGRFLSSLFFGIGYWRVNGNSKKQAWSDEVAGTVVQVRDVNRTLRRAFIAFVMVGFLVDVGVILYGVEVDEHKKNHAAWEKDVSAASTAVQNARSNTNSIISREPATFHEWQSNMRELLPGLDNYDQQLNSYKELFQRGERDALFDSDAELHQIRVLIQVLDLRKQQSAKQRQEAKLVLNYDPSSSTSGNLQSEIRILDSDIGALDQKAADLLAEIGIK